MQADVAGAKAAEFKLGRFAWATMEFHPIEQTVNLAVERFMAAAFVLDQDDVGGLAHNLFHGFRIAVVQAEIELTHDDIPILLEGVQAKMFAISFDATRDWYDSGKEIGMSERCIEGGLSSASVTGKIDSVRVD